MLNVNDILAEAHEREKYQPSLIALVHAMVDNINKELSGTPVLKVKRTDDAKMFPLIHQKKDGDVGYDLPAVFPYREEFKSEDARIKYINENSGILSVDELERNMREYVTIRPGGRQLIPTGIHLEIPKGYWASIEARSSTSKKSLIVPKGVIDEGYRGELFAQLINVGNNYVTVEHGDRYVQLIIAKRESMVVMEVDELSNSERGSSGFGSTAQGERIVEIQIPQHADNVDLRSTFNEDTDHFSLGGPPTHKND